MANLSSYEQELRDKYVEKEEVFKVGAKSIVCVLTIKGGYEHLGHVSNNALDKQFTEDELKDKAIKKAYESLEKHDRFHRSLSN